MNFADKNIVITGGASGIGFALAKQVAAKGARVLLADIRKERLDEAIASLQGEGVEAGQFTCDLSQHSQWQALADHAWSTLGEVHVLFNNAGVAAGMASVFDADLEQARSVFDINFFGMWHGIQVFGKRLIEQGKPCAIYNTGSENSLFNAVPSNSPYIASKHAMLALTHALQEDAPDFMNVGLICPGLVCTELNDATKVMGMPADDFAARVLPQLEADKFFIVSHSYNRVHIDERYQELTAAFDVSAPRYQGDDEYDIRAIVAKMMAAAEQAQTD